MLWSSTNGHPGWDPRRAAGFGPPPFHLHGSRVCHVAHFSRLTRIGNGANLSLSGLEMGRLIGYRRDQPVSVTRYPSSFSNRLGRLLPTEHSSKARMVRPDRIRRFQIYLEILAVGHNRNPRHFCGALQQSPDLSWRGPGLPCVPRGTLTYPCGIR